MVLIMTDTIISSIIAAVASLIICLLGNAYADKKLLPLGTNKVILKEQLFKVYEPLAKAFDSDMPSYQRWDIFQSIVELNYSLIPPKIMGIYRQLKHIDKDEFFLHDDWVIFEKTITSNYNWAKKKLGYPYDPCQIDKKLLVSYEAKQSRQILAISLIDLSAFSFIFLSLIFVLNYSINNYDNKYTNLIVIVGGISFGYLLVRFNGYLSSRSKQRQNKKVDKKRDQKKKQ